MRTAALAMLAVVAMGAQSAGQPPAGAPYPRPQGSHEVSIERQVMVPMRDGVRLATDLYRPTDLTGPLPTILMRTPYNKGANPNGDASARFFASHGYAVAVQDVRGKFESEGQYRVYQGDVTDWSDMFDWAASRVSETFDLRKAQKLVEDGRAAQQRGDQPAIKKATEALWDLLPAGGRAERRGHGSSVR